MAGGRKLTRSSLGEMDAELQSITEIHPVSVGEAAASQLMGVFLPDMSPTWAAGITDIARSVEWELHHLDAALYTAAMIAYSGKLISFLALQGAGQQSTMLPASQCQYLDCRVTLDHPVALRSGFVVLIRNPAMVATDQLVVSYTYRKVRR